MENLKAVTNEPFLDVLGAKVRSVLRKCGHTPEEHAAMCQPNEGCSKCKGDGLIWHEKYFIDCSCMSFCCKWITERQVSIPWCTVHDAPGEINDSPYGMVSLQCIYDRDDCNISSSVAWKTITVSKNG